MKEEYEAQLAVPQMPFHVFPKSHGQRDKLPRNMIDFVGSIGPFR